MVTQLANVVIDAVRPAAVARFWADLLGWQVVPDSTASRAEQGQRDPGTGAPDGGDVVAVRPPDSDGCAFGLLCSAVSERKEVKNRVHLDLASATAAQQRSIVDKAVGLGAATADIGQGALPWEVLTDPEGNEFCVLEPRTEYAGTGSLAAIVADAFDPIALAPFWSAATGWEIVRRDPSFVSMRHPGGHGPWLELLRNESLHPDGRRLRLQLTASGAGPADGEVAWLRRSGAGGQGNHSVLGTVLAAPEGGELIVAQDAPGDAG
ncbi:VOC family protein [Saccharomonospora sp. NPDC046836]|uniref:VOC family protein n=1 Tax=Saccharomonospora sp. NPDC046836 TaxID=3156921 RepID=UPI0033E501AC